MVEVSEQFLIDGKEFRIISGAVHYFRILPEYWRDRLEKLKNMGCNTVEFYIPWNFHEEKQGRFDWSGRRDVVRFMELAQELGLYMIVRTSPYTCGEWEFGGLPSWLLKDRGMRLRCSYPPYLAAVKAYYEKLMPKLVPFQQDRGGGIILIQIENEYGYYGNDSSYLRFLADTMRRLGITVPFVTSDGPWSRASFKNGSLPGVWPTGNFGSQVEKQFAAMKDYMDSPFPLMCMEFWCGWFDAWGGIHHTSDLAQNVKDLEDVLRLGHVNFYMFEGGTNFGFSAGRNATEAHADITSYDYDAILTEDGQLTEKYRAFKEVIARHTPIAEVPLSTAIKRKAYGTLECSGKVDLFSALPALAEPRQSPYPLCMEELDQSGGFLLYRTKLAPYEEALSLRFDRAADRAAVFEDGIRIAALLNEELSTGIKREKGTAGATLDLLFENVGRVNFGPLLEVQRKGIAGNLIVNDHVQYGFEHFGLPLDEAQLSRLDFAAGWRKGLPAFYRFAFEADESCDTFLDCEGFAKGVAFINGFNLGRFWEIGPQKRLYIPAPLVRKGRNELIVFESEGKAQATVTLCDSTAWA